jgi:ketosteroid isomerase-like protein
MSSLTASIVDDAAQRVFKDATSAWANRDLERTLSFMSEDVVHTLNISGASTTGKRALRKKLQLILDTFEFGAFVTDRIVVTGKVVRANIKIIYIHIGTHERLNVRFRFVCTVRDGLIVHLEEWHDAAYFESFMRLVSPPA